MDELKDLVMRVPENIGLAIVIATAWWCCVVIASAKPRALKERSERQAPINLYPRDYFSEGDDA